MFNKLYDAFDQARQGLETASLADKIDAVVEHTHVHFERENEKVFALNFPPYAIHKQLDDVVNTWKNMVI